MLGRNGSNVYSCSAGGSTCIFFASIFFYIQDSLLFHLYTSSNGNSHSFCCRWKLECKRKARNQNCSCISLYIFPLALLPCNGVTPVVVGAKKFLSTTFSRKAQKLPPRWMWPGQSKRDSGSTGPELAFCHAVSAERKEWEGDSVLHLTLPPWAVIPYVHFCSQHFMSLIYLTLKP